MPELPLFNWNCELFLLYDQFHEPLHSRMFAAVTATGLIWSRYSMVITPVGRSHKPSIFLQVLGFQTAPVHSSGLLINLRGCVLQKNWNLFSVNVAMATTGIYQLSRKIRWASMTLWCDLRLLVHAIMQSSSCSNVYSHIICMWLAVKITWMFLKRHWRRSQMLETVVVLCELLYEPFSCSSGQKGPRVSYEVAITIKDSSCITLSTW